jgi:dTDP-glucose 4,6-dehydratase
MTTIFVTGGAGFIGSNFCRYIYKNRPNLNIIILDALTYAGNIENIKDIILDNERVQFWQGDVNDVELVHDLTSISDFVVHFAAETHVARSLYANRVFFHTDIMGTQSICSAVQKFKNRVRRFIHISTSEVYGTSLTEPMDEEHPLNPTSPYAGAKAGADRTVCSYCKAYNIPAVTVRPFNQYGPNQHLEKVVPRFITNLINDEPLSIHGDGSARRDWVWVGDTVKGIIALLDAPEERVIGETFNLGTGISTSVLDLADIIGGMMGKSGKLDYMTERLGQVQNHISSTEKLYLATGFKAETPLVEGLKKTIEWYEAHREWWKNQTWLKKVPVRTENNKTLYW